MTSRLFVIGPTDVLGIVAAAGYTAADAFGGKFVLDVPKEGTIATVVFHDYDDEGISKEIVLFTSDFVATTDNAEFDPSDADMLNCVGIISVATFYNYKSNQVGIATPALYYIAPQGKLWGQMVTRGADNIASGSDPDFTMVVV